MAFLRRDRTANPPPADPEAERRRWRAEFARLAGRVEAWLDEVVAAGLAEVRTGSALTVRHWDGSPIEAPSIEIQFPGPAVVTLAPEPRLASSIDHSLFPMIARLQCGDRFWQLVRAPGDGRWQRYSAISQQTEPLTKAVLQEALMDLLCD